MKPAPPTSVPVPIPTLVEVLSEAAIELVNCEADSDAHADRQLLLADCLRAASARLAEEIAFAVGQASKPETLISGHYLCSSLERINGGPINGGSIPSTPPSGARDE